MNQGPSAPKNVLIKNTQPESIKSGTFSSKECSYKKYTARVNQGPSVPKRTNKQTAFVCSTLNVVHPNYYTLHDYTSPSAKRQLFG